MIYSIFVLVIALTLGLGGSDTTSGEVSQKEVTAVFVRETDHIDYLTIADEHGRMQERARVFAIFTHPAMRHSCTPYAPLPDGFWYNGGNLLSFCYDYSYANPFLDLRPDHVFRCLYFRSRFGTVTKNH